MLLDLAIDERGVVRRVDVVTPPSAPATRAVLVDRDAVTGRTAERVLDARYDPGFGPAARAALLGTRFTPTLRDGKPVARMLRMTVEFAPPAQG